MIAHNGRVGYFDGGRRIILTKRVVASRPKGRKDKLI
jgi:hypothetical protein